MTRQEKVDQFLDKLLVLVEDYEDGDSVLHDIRDELFAVAKVLQEIADELKSQGR